MTTILTIAANEPPTVEWMVLTVAALGISYAFIYLSKKPKR
jgi:hypothetical protein